ncbi:MAG: RMD1 family protein [Betaproteobacteria bacterium]|nr:RMD1 family protein [Betaproteobacteria bacterium]
MKDLPIFSKTAFTARAVLVGERIDLKAWQVAESLATNPLAVAVRGGGVAVLFRYGVVVFFDVQPMEEVTFTEGLRPLVANPYPAPEVEQVPIRIDPGTREALKGGVVYLEAVSLERLQIIADVLSKSVMLALYESRIAGDFERIEPLALELSQRGRIAGHGRELARNIGAMLLIEQRMIGRAEVGEKPEILWDHADLEGLFARLEDELEIQERHRVLDLKLSLVTHTAQTLLELLNARHSIRVEWYIVILIVVEIVLTVYELFVR